MDSSVRIPAEPLRDEMDALLYLLGQFDLPYHAAKATGLNPAEFYRAKQRGTCSPNLKKWLKKNKFLVVDTQYRRCAYFGEGPAGRVEALAFDEAIKATEYGSLTALAHALQMCYEEGHTMVINFYPEKP